MNNNLIKILGITIGVSVFTLDFLLFERLVKALIAHDNLYNIISSVLLVIAVVVKNRVLRKAVRQFKGMM